MLEKTRFFYYRTFISIFTLLAVAVAVFTIVGSLLVKGIFLSDQKRKLDSLLDRIAKDFYFEDGNWKVDRYLSDPLTPHPNGSSGFTKPLYIFTADGFVIERANPITGFMDVSDYNKLRLLSSPQFIHAETGEEWRVETKELINNGEPVGLILVSAYNPDESSSAIDANLKNNLDMLSSKIKFNQDGSINVSAIDVRNIGFNVSFEIITKFNKVLLNNGRTPSFIDVSYIDTLLSRDSFTTTDANTHEPFLVMVKKVKDDNGNLKGVVASAQSLQETNYILNSFLKWTFILEGIFLIPFALISNWLFIYLTDQRIENSKIEDDFKRKMLPKQITFDKKNSQIIIDGTGHKIPYASNQFYLCDAVFSFPKKRWENDELLERMGDNKIIGTRKIYDAYLALNKRFDFDLVSYQNKTYILNPDLLPILNK